MKTISFVLALLLIGCASVTSAPLSIQPEVQTAEWAQKWWMPRHQDKLVEKTQRTNIDLVFLGDSITHAWENRGKEVWQQYYAPRNGFNLGFSGDRTEHVLWRLQNGALDGLNPKLLVLMIGTNNTGHRQDAPHDTATGVQHIIDLVKFKLPKTKILLLAVFPRGATINDPLRQINHNLNQLIKEYDDQERVHFLDINHVFLDANGNLSKTVMKDLLHPNKNQYKVWAEAIEPSIKTLLGE